MVLPIANYKISFFEVMNLFAFKIFEVQDHRNVEQPCATLCGCVNCFKSDISSSWVVPSYFGGWLTLTFAAHFPLFLTSCLHPAFSVSSPYKKARNRQLLSYLTSDAPILVHQTHSHISSFCHSIPLSYSQIHPARISFFIETHLALYKESVATPNVVF